MPSSTTRLLGSPKKAVADCVLRARYEKSRCRRPLNHVDMMVYKNTAIASGSQPPWKILTAFAPSRTAPPSGPVVPPHPAQL
jgi:hypothetical protein